MVEAFQDQPTIVTWAETKTHKTKLENLLAQITNSAVEISNWDQGWSQIKPTDFGGKVKSSCIAVVYHLD